MSIIRNALTTVLGGASLAMMLSMHLTAAVTAIPAPEFIPMPAPEINLAGAEKVLAQKSFMLQMNDTLRVFGRVDIVSSVNGAVYVETHTKCTGPGGAETQLGGAAQNHEGQHGSGPSYPWPGELALYPSLLFKAPTTGTFTCQLLANAGDARLSVVATGYDGSHATYLQVSATPDATTSYAGASWWQNPVCDEWGNNGAGPDGPSYCVYLAGASNLQQLYVFDTDGTPPQMWDAPTDTAFVDVSDNLMLTTCHYGTSSCTTNNSQSWSSYYIWDIGRDGTVVDTHVELIQFNSTGGVCMITQSPEQRSTVGNVPHHYMIYHSLSTVPVYPECGSRKFKLRISVKYVSGNPVKVDGPPWTHAYAFKSFSGTAPAVPNLIGLTKGVANSYLTASGFVASTVSDTLNSAPAGTVIAQSPSTVQICPGASCVPVGIIELPGSGVNFTVSTGGMFVPNVLSIPQSSATAAIKAQGLVPAVYFQKACINPGEVLTQSPPAGTLVAYGSTVSITVDSGTYKNCGVLK
jgi:hypothetical protein